MTSDCQTPPQEPSSKWVQEGSACWDQNTAYGKWMVSDGSASVTQPGFSVNMTWSMPGQIAGSGGEGSIAVTTTGGVVQRICVLQAYTSFTIGGGGDSCAQTSASMQSASATPKLLPNDAADGTLGYVWVSLGDGGNLYYTYKASNPQPKPTVEKLPTPSVFGQTVTAPEPPPGGAALISSPSLNSCAVRHSADTAAAVGAACNPATQTTVDVSGLSVRDQIIYNARHDCYVQAVKALRGVAATRVVAQINAGLEALEQRSAAVLSDLAACVATADALAKQLYSARDARASCSELPIVLSLKSSGRNARVRSVRFGDSHAPLKVSCVRSAQGLGVTVAARSKGVRLSSIVGTRLRIAIVRARTDRSGGQLSIAFHR